MGMTITTKSCQDECTGDTDCRWNEEELTGSPWYPGCGEYGCYDYGDFGEFICVDPRNYT